MGASERITKLIESLPERDVAETSAVDESEVFGDIDRERCADAVRWLG